MQPEETCCIFFFCHNSQTSFPPITVNELSLSTFCRFKGIAPALDLFHHLYYLITSFTLKKTQPWTSPPHTLTPQLWGMSYSIYHPISSCSYLYGKTLRKFWVVSAGRKHCNLCSAVPSVPHR